MSHVRMFRLALGDGETTAAYVATYPLAQTRMRVVRLPALSVLATWCTQTGVDEALVGGFYVRHVGIPPETLHAGSPLGELWLDGVVQRHVPFTPPWGDTRACVHVLDGTVQIARRDALPTQPAGDLLQAGPLLVTDGAVVDGDYEGFSAGAGQFDSDITVGRHPRAALGHDGERLIALVCDGRSDDDTGLTIGELASAMVQVGAREALNLDGGGSTTLVCGGRLRNVPRESHGMPVPGGRAIATALVFTPR
jgi:hypothetical protein